MEHSENEPEVTEESLSEKASAPDFNERNNTLFEDDSRLPGLYAESVAVGEEAREKAVAEGKDGEEAYYKAYYDYFYNTFLKK